MNRDSAPIVRRTGRAPTGHEVTFRYADPAARAVYIKGEWFLGRPSDWSQLAGTPERPVIESQGILPAAWQPGDIPIAHPNAVGPNWPVQPMERQADGTWSFTIPLPPGVFTYSFLVDGEGDPAGWAPIADPSNPPWNEAGGQVTGSRAPNSQVFVPADRDFGATDLWWQGPARVRGQLLHHTYASPGHVAPTDQNHLVVYLPPAYDPGRARPYPTLWLSHGGGENEMGWSTQGALGNIMDNLIASGEIAPAVVVMPNALGYPPSAFNEAYDRDLIENMLPFVEARYHVARDPSGRAFAGLSLGGQITNSFMLKYPELFAYYGMFSSGLPPAHASLTDAEAGALRRCSVFIGGGWQDPIHEAGYQGFHRGTARQISTFARAGIPLTTSFVHGGHNWHVWRQLLRDFLTRVAFLPRAFAHWE